MIELADHSRWITGSEAAAMAGISNAALRKRRAREDAGRHPRHTKIGSAALYPLEEFTTYVATWTDERLVRRDAR